MSLTLTPATRTYLRGARELADHALEFSDDPTGEAAVQNAIVRSCIRAIQDQINVLLGGHK